MSMMSLALHQLRAGAPGRASAATVSVGAANGAPELQVRMLDAAGQPRGEPVHIAAGPVGSAVVDPELTPLAHGGEVLSWVDAYSHGLQAHFAVLDRAGQVLADSTYGQGYSSAFEAVALPDGGFALADGETDLFGLHGALTFQTFSPGGAPVGPETTVASGASPSGGMHYADLEGVWTPAGVELSWSDQAGGHSALIQPGGEPVDPAHALAAAAGPFSSDFALGGAHGWSPLPSEMFGLPGPSHQAGWLL